MNFLVQPAALKSAFSAVNKAVSNKNAMPILDNILFSPTPSGRLSMTASDGNNMITTELEVEEAEGLAPFMMSASYLGNYISNGMGQWPVSFEVTFDTGFTEIVISDMIGDFHSVCADKPEEYPKQDALSDKAVSVVMPADKFVCAMLLGSKYTANDDMRPILSGVCLEIGAERVMMAASDSRKLFKELLPGVGDGAQCQLVFSRKLVACLSLLSVEEGATVNVTYDGRFIIVSQGNVEIRGRLIEGRYPRIDVAIPKNNDRIVVVDRAKLIAAVKRVSFSSNSSVNQIVLEFDGSSSIKLSASDIDNSTSASVSIPTTSQSGFNGPFIIGVRGSSFDDVLSTHKGEDSIALLMSDPSRAIIVKPSVDSDRTTLIMPLLIQ